MRLGVKKENIKGGVNMKFITDVWVNWFEGEENAHLIPHYFEWYKSDKPDLMDTLPLLKLNTNLYNYIEFGLNRVADVALTRIKNKAYLRKSQEKVLIEYAFIMTDGKGIMAVQLDSEGYVQKKSRLIPRQERLVHEMEEDKINDFELTTEVDISKYTRFEGLTRLEKNIMIKATKFIDKLSPNHLGMLKYIVAEYDLKLHKKLNTTTFKEIKHKLLEEFQGSEISRLVALNKVIDKLDKIIN